MKKNEIDEKKNLHMAIDNSFDEILKYLDSIFDAMMFNDDTSIEEPNNLVISNSASNITNNIKNLLAIINKMKLKYLQTFDNKKHHQKSSSENKMSNPQKAKLHKYQDLHNRISKQLRDWKQSDTYKICESLIKDQK